MPQDFLRHGEAPPHMTGKLGLTGSMKRDFIRGTLDGQGKKSTDSDESLSSSGGGQTSPPTSEIKTSSETPSVDSQDEGSTKDKSKESEDSFAKLRKRDLKKWKDKELNKFLRANDYKPSELKEMSRVRKQDLVRVILEEG